MVVYNDNIKNHWTIVFDLVVDWTWKRLSFADDVDITFDFADLSKDAQGDLRGYCLCDPEDIKDFEILIANDMHKNDVMITIIHEMVHAWQHSTGNPISEPEAYRMEEELFNEYNNST